ncbi:hypothetical protein Tco_1083396, partial [Tanacetum coccineum]
MVKLNETLKNSNYYTETANLLNGNSQVVTFVKCLKDIKGPFVRCQRDRKELSDKGIFSIPPEDTFVCDSILNPNTESTPLVDVHVTTSAEIPSSIATLPPPPIPLIQDMQQTPFLTPTTVPSSSLENLPNFGSLFGFDNRLKMIEHDFLEFKQTNQFANVVSSIPRIVYKYLASKLNDAVNVAVTKILSRIEKLVNDQLESEVLTRSSSEFKTSHAVATSLSELELKKILIDKMENNKSIDRSDPQKTLYKALMDAYETDKDILEAYGDTVPFKRHLDEQDDDEEPSAGSNRGSKRRRSGKEPESTSAPNYTSIFDRDWNKTVPAAHRPIQPWISTIAQNKDHRESFNELMDTPLDFSAFMMNRLKVDTLTPELLVGLTFELMKVIPFDHFINNDLAYLSGGVSSRTYTTSVTKTKAADYGHIKWIEDLIVKWHNYKHLDWITVRRDDDKLYKFKKGKLTNLTVEECIAFSVSLRMFTRSISSKGDVGSTQGYPLASVEVHRFNTSAGNPIKEILLKLNLSDHRSILMDSHVTPTKHGRMTKPYSSPRFIANYFISGTYKDGHGVALDNALVAPEKRLKIEKYNARIEFSKPQREETYEVTLEALKLSSCYPAFQITAKVPEIYMHQFWNTINKIRNSDAYNFKLDKKKCRVDTEVFHEILQIYPRLPNQEFGDLPSEDDLVSFIKELSYSSKCEMLSVIHTDQMHQPWRTFAA